MTASDFRDSIFTDDVVVSKKNLPWLMFSCCLALAGSMLFGLFFGQREAQSVHAKERMELVQGFAQMTNQKDEQIKALTDTIIVVERQQVRDLGVISDTVEKIGDAMVSIHADPASTSKILELSTHLKKLRATKDATTVK